MAGVSIYEEFLQSEMAKNAENKELFQSPLNGVSHGEIEQFEDHSKYIEEEGKDEVRLIAIKLEDSIVKLDPERSWSNNNNICIYRVPIKLRAGNIKFYSPRVVSIGPFHFGKSKYERMEKLKLQLLGIVIQESYQPLMYYVDHFRGHVDTVRESYSEQVEGELQNNDAFLGMMLRDGAFIIKFMNCFDPNDHCIKYYVEDKEERIYISPQENLDIENDLKLLENQLPYSFLQSLNSVLFDNQRKTEIGENKMKREIINLAETYWDVLVPKRRRKTMLRQRHKHFLDHFRRAMLPPAMEGASEVRRLKCATEHIRSAKKLQEAGVKVTAAKSQKQITAYAHFNGHGKLTVKPLVFDDYHHALYRNLVAFEHCHYPTDMLVSDYLIFMEMLTRDGSEDLLVKNGVIEDNIKTDGVTATAMLRSILKNVTYATHPFGMVDLCRNVNVYCNRPTHRLRAAFNSKTWQIGATIALLLTLLQTIFAALDFFNLTFQQSKLKHHA